MLSNNKSYEPDFYLVEYDVYLDPKSKFFGLKQYQGYDTESQIEKIKLFENEYNTICLILWAHEKGSFKWEYIKRRMVERYTHQT